MASLLFLAFAYFVVGKVADKRNDAQGAADAAALAAAQEARDQIGRDLLGSILDPVDWQDLLDGRGFGTGSSCAEAGRFATSNESRLTACDPYFGARWGFTVKVETRDTVGQSVIPGTANKRGKATARAIIEPRCSFEVKPAPDDGDDPGSGEEDDKPVFPGVVRCDSGDLPIDPESHDPLPDLADLFKVRLVESD
ncbi:pilus assembly protein TadG-related protein [Streptomyces sp. NPDC058280]|uniref:pilus assembly protein TadG-related protein n=1 Tax=Streptomyces sp. NPDC058280 TaxID=3346419 RepID=UPI0036EFDDA9